MKRSINIEYTWWRDGDPNAPIHRDHVELLDERARTHTREMTDDGFTAGQLHETVESELEGMQITYIGWWTYKYIEVPDFQEKPIWRCTFCCKDTKTIPCEHCQNDLSVTDRTKPHRPEWSRYSIQEVECKVCDRRGPYSIQQTDTWCHEHQIPKPEA